MFSLGLWVAGFQNILTRGVLLLFSPRTTQAYLL